MTTPATPVTKPTKAWITAIGGILSVAVPLITSLLTYLPPEWAAVITGAIGLLTVLGVYAVPNKPTGDVVIPTSEVPPVGGVSKPVQVDTGGYINPGEYKNPYRS